MEKKLLVTYKSITGFTKEYAEMIAEEISCTLINFKDVTVERMSTYDTVIFGGRMHAGTVDGLKKAKAFFSQSKASNLVLFTTGATPNDAKDLIDEMWSNNLSSFELQTIPHFYFQSGLRYEKMPFGDRLMMKVFSIMLKKKKDKNEYEKTFENAIASSYDISSKTYIKPLIDILNAEKQKA